MKAKTRKTDNEKPVWPHTFLCRDETGVCRKCFICHILYAVKPGFSRIIPNVVNTLCKATKINAHLTKGKYKPFILFHRKVFGEARFFSLKK